jgi:cytochrome d ubiquinol oxidase subunit I
MADFGAVVTNKFALLTFLHTVSASYILSAFFVMGVSAYHLLKRRHVDFFMRSFRPALVMGLLCCLFIVAQGHLHGEDIAKAQPAKLAAMESHWETKNRAPFNLFIWPDEDAEQNHIALGPLPGLLSLLAHHDPDATVLGLKEFAPDERPRVMPVYLSFRLMVGLGFYFLVVTLVAWFRRKRLLESRLLLTILLYSIPLPYLATQLGWVVTEVGRQPWIVYGLMKTRDAVSPISGLQVIVTFVAFIVVYLSLTIIAFRLIARAAKTVPEVA